MKTLTPAADAAMINPDAAPLLLLKLSLPSGTYWYADRDLLTPVVAEGRITEVSSIASVVDESRGGGDARVRVVLRDEDRALHTLLDSDEFYEAPASLYQHFDVLGESDLVPLLDGLIATAPHWREQSNDLLLEIQGMEALLADRMLGRFADRLTFPDVAKEDEGQLLPLIYGKPQRVRSVLVQAGAKTELADVLGYHDEAFRVQDAVRFSSGTIRLRIDQEVVEGSFNGNLFTITARGVEETGGTFGANSGNTSIVHTDLTGVENTYVGKQIRATVSASVQTRLVLKSDGGTLYLSSPFRDGAAYVRPDMGSTFTFVTQQALHKAGARVYQEGVDWVYLLNDRPSAYVSQVEAPGRVETEQTIGESAVSMARDGYTPLPPTMYTINTNDTTTLPALGRAVTTLTLRMPPALLPQATFLDDTVWATLEGVPGSGGEALENPADVIQDLLINAGGLDAGAIDATSFATSAAARSAVKCAFAVPRRMTVAQAVQELAFQSRMALLWEGGQVKLHPLSNAQPAVNMSLDASQIALESVELHGKAQGERVTEIVGQYQRAGENTAVRIRDEAEYAAYGSHEARIDFWGFQSRHEVFLAAHWWLARWRSQWREVTVKTFLPGLPVERLDGVALSHPLLPGGGATGLVRAIEHRPGNAQAGEIDTVALTLRMPYIAGCATNCETSCETSACESGSCELSCTATNETGCVNACESARQSGGGGGGGGSSYCYTTCQLACRSGAEVYTPNCGVNCETGCEVACEGMAFETSCATGCQTSAESIYIIRDIIHVQIVSAPSAPFGQAAVIERMGGVSIGESFTASDVFDLHYPSGADCTAVLTRNGTWVLVPGARNVKYVKVTGGAGPSYTVTEQSAGGSTWGASFSATAVDAT